jgi:hypothetical protein
VRKDEQRRMREKRKEKRKVRKEKRERERGIFFCEKRKYLLSLCRMMIC